MCINQLKLEIDEFLCTADIKCGYRDETTNRIL